MYEHLLYDERDGVATVTLDRPESLNALSPGLGSELRDVVQSRLTGDGVRAAILTGSGRAFCAGVDLKKMERDESGSPAVRTSLQQTYEPIIRGLQGLDKPIVAALNGPALGIGGSLALACDMIVASETASFTMAFISVGLIPDGGGTALVPAAVGKARAFEMIMLGETVDAQTALEWGLVNAVYPPAELEARVQALALRLASGPTRAYAAAKQAMNGWLLDGFDRQLDLELTLQERLVQTQDFVEGVQAFIDKREPEFTGS